MMLSVLVIAISCAWAQGQDAEQINPLDVGRAFALKSPTYFKCTLYGNALVGDVWQPTIMEFVTRKSDHGITNLVVNGMIIPLPKPIYGLPMGDGGIIKDVNVNVTAFTDSGEYAGNGYTYAQAVSTGDQIEVILRPADVRREIPVDVGRYGNDIKLEIEGFTYGYGYGIDGGKFYVYLPPVGGTYHYILRRWSTGEPIGEGWIEPYKDPVISNNAFVGIRYIGNVVGVEFERRVSDQWISVPRQSFDCSIPTEDGTNVLGKVIWADVGQSSLEVSIHGSFDVYVYQATEEGDMPLLELEDHSSNYQTRVNTVRNKVGKAVIVVVPRDSSAEQTTWIDLHKYLGSPSLPPVVIGKG